MCHVAMISDDLPHMLRRHVLLLSLHEAELALLTVTLGLQLLPFASYSRRPGSHQHTLSLLLLVTFIL